MIYGACYVVCRPLSLLVQSMSQAAWRGTQRFEASEAGSCLSGLCPDSAVRWARGARRVRLRGRCPWLRRPGGRGGRVMGRGCEVRPCARWRSYAFFTLSQETSMKTDIIPRAMACRAWCRELGATHRDIYNVQASRCPEHRSALHCCIATPPTIVRFWMMRAGKLFVVVVIVAVIVCTHAREVK